MIFNTAGYLRSACHAAVQSKVSASWLGMNVSDGLYAPR